MLTAQIKAKDEKLFAAVQKLMDGNYDSYEDVYELSKKYIYKIINDIVQNHHTTEDMMQETYLQIYNKIGTLREARTFYVWAGRIASNLTLRHLQKYRKEFIQSASGEDDEDFMFDKLENDHEAFIPETVLENEEQQRIIAGILDGLSPEQKLTVQYYYFEEMSVGDIANVMECSTGTVKSRLNYARKSLKVAVNEFEVANDVKLYSLSSLPIFFIVYKAVSEGFVLFAGGAAVAGGVLAEGAAVSGGSVGTSGASGVAGASAAGTGAASTATVGSVAASTTGFISTIAGKITIMAVSVTLATGTAVVQAEVTRNEMISSGEYEVVMQQVEAVREENGLDSWLEVEDPILEESPTVEYNSITELIADSDEEEEIVASSVENIDEEYVDAVNNLAAAMVRYENALEYSLTSDQKAYLDQLMSAYEYEIEDYLEMGQAYTMVMEADTTHTFEDVYYPQIIDMLNREAEIVNRLADIYYKEEVKNCLAQYTASDLQEVMEMGGGIGDLIINDLSESTYNELVACSQDFMDYLNDFMILNNEMMSDPVMSQYMQ